MSCDESRSICTSSTGERELAVEEAGAGVDHDLATGGGFDTGDPLGADVVEVVLASSHAFCASRGRPGTSLCRL